MMDPMDITATADFTADPNTVFAMLTDPAFLEEVCVAGHAVNHEITVDGTRTISRRGLPAPDNLKTFTGSVLTIVEDITWGAAAADGSRRGDLVLTVDGQPARMTGTVDLAPHGAGSRVTVNGDLKVSIPLVGKKMEKAAAPAVLEGIRVQEKVGRDWLARSAG